MSTPIPLVDLRREYARIRSEIDESVARVLRQGWFVLGEETEAFEEAWAVYCGTSHAIGVGNGSDAIQLTLWAAGIGPGDEVILPALTSAFTALAVAIAGAQPVFVDVDPERTTLDPEAFAAGITPRTAAVVPVHLYGCPAKMAPILEIAQRHGLLVLEDASQAHGARYEGSQVGSLGKVAAFSFYPSTNLGAYGDAGAVTTDDSALAEKLRALRHGGQHPAVVPASPGATWAETLGTSSRMDDIQAAILGTKLRHLSAWNKRRRSVASRYQAGLRSTGSLALPPTPEDAELAPHRYLVRASLRDKMREYLAGAGIDSGMHSIRGVAFGEAYASLGYKPGSCPNAERIAAQAVLLPVFPQISSAEVDKIVRLIRIFLAIH
ncbi:MAG: DegT/DnrJ/EryC1/StrS family aminotransferase [Anaerolineae bacterium]|nr:DegT/DnrJ/EryC1/StrS family aminotransferase [Anaerolineae bacterium]